MLKQEGKDGINAVQRKYNETNKSGSIADAHKEIAPFLKDVSDTRKDAVDFVKNAVKTTGDDARWNQFMQTMSE